MSSCLCLYTPVFANAATLLFIHFSIKHEDFCFIFFSTREYVTFLSEYTNFRTAATCCSVGFDVAKVVVVIVVVGGIVGEES